MRVLSSKAQLWEWHRLQVAALEQAPRASLGAGLQVPPFSPPSLPAPQPTLEGQGAGPREDSCLGAAAPAAQSFLRTPGSLYTPHRCLCFMEEQTGPHAGVTWLIYIAETWCQTPEEGHLSGSALRGEGWPGTCPWGCVGGLPAGQQKPRVRPGWALLCGGHQASLLLLCSGPAPGQSPLPAVCGPSLALPMTPGSGWHPRLPCPSPSPFAHPLSTPELMSSVSEALRSLPTKDCPQPHPTVAPHPGASAHSSPLWARVGQLRHAPASGLPGPSTTALDS